MELANHLFAPFETSATHFPQGERSEVLLLSLILPASFCVNKAQEGRAMEENEAGKINGSMSKMLQKSFNTTLGIFACGNC